MKSLKTAFSNQAQKNTGFARRLFASLAKEAGKREDSFARASFIEGLTGRSPGSLARNADKALSELLSDLTGNKDNRILEIMRYKKNISDRDMQKLLGSGDLKLFEALKFGAASGMGGGLVRGLEAEDVAMAIAMGISPLTGEPLRYGKGKNVFYHIGHSAGSKVSVGGLASILKAEAKNRAIDILRGTPKGELEALGIDEFAYQDEGSGSLTLGDMIEAPTQYRSQYVDLMDAIFSDSSIISHIDREIFPMLKGDVQREVWAAIKANPDLLNLRGGRVVIRNKELAEALGGDASPQAAGKVLNQKVWPAVEMVLTSGEMSKMLLKKRQILEVIQEAKRNRGSGKSRTKNIGISGLPDPEPHSPVRYQHGPFQLKGSLATSSRRVVAKYMEYVENREGFEKSAWKLPPKDARLYKKMKDWAVDNWEQFLDPRDRLDFDEFAKTLAKRFGDSGMVSEPTHWLWEIVYDVGRLKPS